MIMPLDGNMFVPTPITEALTTAALANRALLMERCAFAHSGLVSGIIARDAAMPLRREMLRVVYDLAYDRGFTLLGANHGDFS